MDIIWSLGLLVVIVLAFNLMAGGRSSTIVRPAIRIAENLLAFAVKTVLNTLGSVFRIGGVKLPKSNPGKDNGPSGPPPPRWDKGE